MSHFWTDVFSILFAISSVFLIFIVLLQRGRGGGLAGAFGATGGQSAFGTKAGDVFTRITIGVAVVWVALAAVTGFAMTRESQGRFESQAQQAPADVQQVLPAPPGKGAGANVNKFETGDEGGKKAPATNPAANPATKGTPAKQSKQPPAGKSSATVTPPPAKTAPPANAGKQPAP